MKKIKFLDIEDIVFDYVNKFDNVEYPTLDQILTTNQHIQDEINKKYWKR